MALYQLAIPFIFVFFAGLAQMMPTEDPAARTLAWAGFAGAVGLQCVAVAGSIPFVAATWRGASDDMVRLVYDASLVAIYPLTAGLSIASILLPSVAGTIAGTLPRILLAIALIVVAANLAEIAGFLAYQEGPMALGVAPGWVAIPAWTLWVLLTSLTLLLRKS